MQPIEIDPELSRFALAEGAEQYPEFAGLALRQCRRTTRQRSRREAQIRETWSASVRVRPQTSPAISSEVPMTATG